MSRVINLVGQRFGRLTVIEEVERTKGMHVAWLCKCDCGNESIVMGDNLRSGRTKSCGCLWLERITKHGLIHSIEHRTWHNMKCRCNDPNAQQYKNYGKRGIKICDRWLNKEHGFENFLADMGKRPSPKHSIDRINNNGDYEPENCRWTTRKVQANNTRCNHYITFHGRTQTMMQWAEELNISVSSLSARINTYGWSVEIALSKPIRFKRL